MTTRPPADEPPVGLQVVGWSVVCVGVWATVLGLRAVVFYYGPLARFADDPQFVALRPLYLRALAGTAASVAEAALAAVAGLMLLDRRPAARPLLLALATALGIHVARGAWFAGSLADEARRWGTILAGRPRLGDLLTHGRVLVAPVVAAVTGITLATAGRRWLRPCRPATWAAAVVLVTLLEIVRLLAPGS